MKKLTLLYISIISILCACEPKKPSPFEAYRNVEKPVIVGEETLSKNRLQWNNSYASIVQEMYFTKYDSMVQIGVVSLGKNGFEGERFIPFDSRYSYSDVHVNPEGNHMLFQSNSLTNESDTVGDWNLWQSTKVNGYWSEPTLVFEFDMPENEGYPWLTKSGALYFSSTPHGSRNSDIYFSKKVDRKYQKPVKLPASINSEKFEGDGFVDPEEKYIIFSGFDRTNNLGKSDMYISFNNGNGKWSEPVWLGEKFNSEGYDGSPFVTEDEKFLIFTSSRGSTEENTFFNHYIIPFEPSEFEVNKKEG